MTRILIPVAFSTTARHAVLCVLQLFNQAAVQFFLWNTEAIDSSAPETDRSVLQKMTEFMKQLQDVVSAGQELIPIFSSTFGGQDLEPILKQHQIDLLVLSHPLQRSIQVFDTEMALKRLVYQVKIPVLILPQHCSCRPLKQIALLTNYQQRHSIQATSQVKRLVEIHEGCLQLIHLSKKHTALSEHQKENKEFLESALDGIPIDHQFITAENPEQALQQHNQGHAIDVLLFFAKNINLSEHYVFPALNNSTIASAPKVPILVIHE
ncbi:hypothetical protein [Croceiramulus getboli]|nr:hypothetical protein P8624_09535 [Flavobacteriaceae bacterium YJPT1-3]